VKIGIASDHGGYDLKTSLIEQMGAELFLNLGTHSSDRVDYPEIADVLCQRLLSNDIKQGILICGTGIGVSIRANRYDGIRAALVHDEFTAKMSKAHNNANVLCLGGRTTSHSDALTLVQIWLDTAFESGRHVHRLQLLDAAIPK
jgi:ribose 5-phosphate isomerase B